MAPFAHPLRTFPAYIPLLPMPVPPGPVSTRGADFASWAHRWLRSCPCLAPLCCLLPIFLSCWGGACPWWLRRQGMPRWYTGWAGMQMASRCGKPAWACSGTAHRPARAKNAHGCLRSRVLLGRPCTRKKRALLRWWCLRTNCQPPWRCWAFPWWPMALPMGAAWCKRLTRGRTAAAWLRLPSPWPTCWQKPTACGRCLPPPAPSWPLPSATRLNLNASATRRWWRSSTPCWPRSAPWPAQQCISRNWAQTTCAPPWPPAPLCAKACVLWRPWPAPAVWTGTRRCGTPRPVTAWRCGKPNGSRCKTSGKKWQKPLSH